MKVNVKEYLILTLLFVPVCCCFPSNTADVSKIATTDVALKYLKNNTEAKPFQTFRLILSELTTHIDSARSGFENESRKRRHVSSHKKYQRTIQHSEVIDRILSRNSRELKKSKGRVRVTSTTEQNFSIKFPDGFSPPVAPFNPLLYPIASTMSSRQSSTSQVNEAWKPIKYPQILKQEDVKTTTKLSLLSNINEHTLNPILLDTLRETIIYGLPKPNSQESFEKITVKDTDARTVKPLDLISSMESSLISDTDENFEPLISTTGGIDLFTHSTANVTDASKDEEIGTDTVNWKNISKIHNTEERSRLGPTSSQINYDYRMLNDTTWPPSSSEEKNENSSILSSRKNEYMELEPKSGNPKNDLYMDSIEVAATHHAAKLSKPFIDHTIESEPTICFPICFKEKSSTDSDELVDVERVYCFPFPPEFKINFNGANEHATVQILEDEWLNDKVISNGNMLAKNINFLFMAWMMFIYLIN